MTEELVPACDIQEGCNLPQGHMGNCEARGSLDARTPHGFPRDFETVRSGKLTYEVCRRCSCVEEHIVHGWTPRSASLRANESPEAAPSIDQLLTRICQVCPEPSLMDMEDGAHSMTLLLRRAQVLASLHQAKQMERIADTIQSVISPGHSVRVIRTVSSKHSRRRSGTKDA